MSTQTQVVEPESLKRARKKCFERFVELGLAKSQLAFLDKVVAETAPCVDVELVSSLQLPECSYIVLVNGMFCKEASSYDSSGCTILSLKEAYQTYGTLLANSMNKSASTSSTALELLNLAMSQDGVFILLSPKYVASRPLQIISIGDVDEQLILPRVHIFAGAGSELTIIQTKHVTQGALYNSLIQVQCEENARVVFEEVELKSNGDYFEHIRVTLKRSSYFGSTFVNTAARANRDIHVCLAGDGAEAETSGVWLLDSNNAISTKVTMEHLEPHCRSMQLFKGVLAGSSVSNFDGKIHVHKKAQKTQSYQLNKNLLLSEGAKAVSTPNLEIFADDVKASHGATVGKLDSEHLFYLTSRGISQIEAKSFLVYGFCEEVVAKLSSRALQDKANECLMLNTKNDK